VDFGRKAKKRLEAAPAKDLDKWLVELEKRWKEPAGGQKGFERLHQP
jgi:hypothetical protein